jgi:hypothetical protein
LNPDPEMMMGAEDELLVLARDDDSYAPTPTGAEVHDGGTTPMMHAETSVPEEILLCGWRRDVDDVIREFDMLLAKGSKVHMLNEVPIEHRIAKLADGGLDMNELTNIELVHHVGNSSVRREVEGLISGLHEQWASHNVDKHLSSVLLFADEQRETDMMHSDSHTLASLLLIRDVQHRQRRRMGRSGNLLSSCPVVCEVLDHRTRNTIETSPALTQGSDFVQSNEFVSRVLAMVAERREVKCVLDDLFNTAGVRVCIKPSHVYVGPHERLSFFALAKRMLANGELLFGYKPLAAKLADATPVLNPPHKDEAVHWASRNLLVLSAAEDPTSDSDEMAPPQQEQFTPGSEVRRLDVRDGGGGAGPGGEDDTPHNISSDDGISVGLGVGTGQFMRPPRTSSPAPSVFATAAPLHAATADGDSSGRAKARKPLGVSSAIYELQETIAEEQRQEVRRRRQLEERASAASDERRAWAADREALVSKIDEIEKQLGLRGGKGNQLPRWEPPLTPQFGGGNKASRPSVVPVGPLAGSWPPMVNEKQVDQCALANHIDDAGVVVGSSQAAFGRD